MYVFVVCQIERLAEFSHSPNNSRLWCVRFAIRAPSCCFALVCGKSNRGKIIGETKEGNRENEDDLT